MNIPVRSISYRKTYPPVRWIGYLSISHRVSFLDTVAAETIWNWNRSVGTK